MKAIVYTDYGAPDVLQLQDVEKPSPKADEVLVKIYAASINFADKATLMGKPYLLRFSTGLLKPKNTRLGFDVAGRVEAVGSNVTDFKPGDDVYGDLSVHVGGSYAEYIAAPATAFSLKPQNLTYEEAAAIPLAGITALQGIRDHTDIKQGQKVLIVGASGGVGTYALQIAKSYGAEVTAVCSTRNIEMVRSLGADHVIDYTKENFADKPEPYDWILGINGYHFLAEYKRALKEDGTYVCIGGTMPQIFQSFILGPVMSMGSNKSLKAMGVAQATQADLTALKDLIEAEKLVPVIDKCYPLAETAEAFRYFSDVHAQGKVVISMQELECF